VAAAWSYYEYSLEKGLVVSEEMEALVADPE
jgi:hypothetical protein